MVSMWLKNIQTKGCICCRGKERRRLDSEENLVGIQMEDQMQGKQYAEMDDFKVMQIGSVTVQPVAETGNVTVQWFDNLLWWGNEELDVYQGRWM